MLGGGFWRKVGSDIMIEGKRSLVSPDGIFNNIMKYFQQHDKVKTTDIAETFNLSESNAYDKLHTLKKQNKIYFVYDGPEGHWFLVGKEDSEPEIKPMKERIEDYMRKNRSAHVRTVMKALDISYSTARVRLRELKAEGKVNYFKNKDGGHWVWIEDKSSEDKIN